LTDIASQFLPNLPPVSIFSYLQQVQPERFGKKYTLLQQFRAMQAKAWDILQEVERGNRSRLPELCALGPRYRRLRNDLLHMLSSHMALILKGMRQTPGDPLAGALDKSAKALGEGAKILESMDSGTLQKVFEQSGDFITRLTCFHPYEPWEHEQWEGSMYHTEGEENLPGGTWTVSVSVGGQEIGSASCDIPWPEVEPPIPATLFLAFNTAQPPFDIPEVRRALAMAIDREALLDLLGREDTLAAEGLVPPSIWADESYYGQAGVPFDPKRALALLGGHEAHEKWSLDLGSPDRILALASESSLEVAQFIQAQWKEHLGIEVELTVVEEDAYAEGLEALSPHVFLASWHADYKSPYNFLGDAVQDIGKLTKWSNAEYDRLAGEAFQEVHQERRMELCSQAEVILIHGHAIIPLYHYIHYTD
jgi:hypothetical protein